MASIVADVATARGVPLAEMMSRSLGTQDVEARQEAMWRCREVRINSGRHRYSLQQIGQFFKRNHATVIFACQRHLERMTARELAKTDDWVSTGYDYEIYQNNTWRAGGSASNYIDAAKEACQYTPVYGQGDPVEVLIWETARRPVAAFKGPTPEPKESA